MTDYERDPQLDRVTQRTAIRISAALDEMLDELDPGVWAHHTILNCLMRELVPRQRYIMRMVMEDLDLREAYENAVARLPAKPRPWLA
jgi:hypothetical protein